MSTLASPSTGLNRLTRKWYWSLRRRMAPLATAVIPFDGDLKLQIRPIDRLGKTVLLDGYSDREHAGLLYAFLKPGMTYFDIGANFGQFSLVAGQRVGPMGHVHAFEATSRMFTELDANVRLNAMVWVKPNHYAVCRSSQPMTMTLCTPGKEAFSSLGKPSLRSDAQIAGTETVPGITLDDYCANHGITSIDLIKIDVEGAELEVIAGGHHTLRLPNVKTIVAEFSDRNAKGMNSSTAQVRDALEAAGFNLYAFDLDTRSLTPEPPGKVYEKTQNLLALKDPAAFIAQIKKT